ncbi:hypothetical protein U9M48_035466, partial [Paspalum notatum var. saurae]
MGVRPRKFGLNMDVRWNSTYLMLKHLLPYKETFDIFLTTQYPRKPDDPELLTPAHWYVAAKLFEFLELFHDATVSLSVRLQRPTAPTTSTGKRRQNWGMIYADDPGSEFSIPSSAPTTNMSRATSVSALLQAAISGGLNSLETELTSYLDSDTLQKFDDDFNLLNRWHEHKLTYPVLSILARDVISILFLQYLQNLLSVCVAGSLRNVVDVSAQKWLRCSSASKIGSWVMPDCSTLWRTRTWKLLLRICILMLSLMLRLRMSPEA